MRSAHAKRGVKKFAKLPLLFLILIFFFLIVSALPAFSYWYYGTSNEILIDIETKSVAD
ncbi:hypothetical protein AGMMS50229_17490 [Campylobacterota bacterium]|nr:hypothetical protein AGMMS50229_17490 [Campylobacterota bacterium]